MKEITKYLTANQEEILELCSKEGNENAKLNLFSMKNEENYLSAHRISSEREDDFNEVERYLNSLGDYEVRKKAMIEEANKKYREFQCEIDKLVEKGVCNEEIWKIIVPNENEFLDYIGIEYGFSDSELFKIISNKLNFYDIEKLDIKHKSNCKVRREHGTI